MQLWIYCHPDNRIWMPRSHPHASTPLPFILTTFSPLDCSYVVFIIAQTLLRTSLLLSNTYTLKLRTVRSVTVALSPCACPLHMATIFCLAFNSWACRISLPPLYWSSRKQCTHISPNLYAVLLVNLPLQQCCFELGMVYISIQLISPLL